ncbi:MAG TPA: aldehyde dehydrogenase family protein [Acidobacteriaceae bacterium]|jgi:acyl-CoA reductase-like NAD-dependent aldehyde dehydrogenase|nr:aldehyde dehydrogenase family protein [Acidobacteriaceae bacterium]
MNTKKAAPQKTPDSGFSSKEIGFLIGGQEHRSGQRIAVYAPYDQVEIGCFWQATRADADAAVAAAVRSFAHTRALSSYERHRILTAVAVHLAEKREAFASTIVAEAGKPITAARAEVDRAIFTFRIAAEEATRMGGEIMPLDLLPTTTGRWGLSRRFPLGPVLAVTPFNFPLNLVAHKLAPAIACGCPVLLKPAPQTPFSAYALVRAILDAGWPADALAFLPLSNQDTAHLVEQDHRIRVLSFTGSARVGWELKAKAAKKRVLLELGGNAAVIVHSDWPDLTDVAQRVANGGFSYAGQSCISVQRVYVERTIFAPFMNLLLERVAALHAGDPAEETTDIGPVIRPADAERIEQWVQQAVRDGAKLLAGGTRRGSLLAPTVLTGTRSPMAVLDEEIFGPVIVVEPYESFDGAVAAVNQSRYGLQAGLFTTHVSHIFHAYNELEVGAVIVGDVPTWRLDPMPYGGVKDSGQGREGLRNAMEEMTEPRLLVMALDGPDHKI